MKSEDVSLRKDVVEELHPDLVFRYRFVSGYGFQLKREKMLGLVDNNKGLFEKIKGDLSCFWDKI